MKDNKTPNKNKEMAILQKAEDLSSIICGSTRLPYVECDAETCDDQILVFETLEAAEKEAERLTAEGFRVKAGRIPEKQRLGFYANLYPLGVNAILVQDKEGNRTRLELNELINRPEMPKFTLDTRKALQNGEKPQFRVENPEFHLTALYFAQLSRGTKADQHTEELKDLQEEMMAHYKRGFYIAARTEEGGTPLLKTKDGAALQPIFTDMQEFLKFKHTNTSTKVATMVVTEAEFLKHLAKEATGVIVNPLGIGLALQVNRNTPEQKA